MSESYFSPTPFTSLAVDPNTEGLWTAQGTNLYFADRRQQEPNNMAATTLMNEPLYGLDARYDETQPGLVR